MAITVRGKNLDITPALRDYVEKRVKKVTKYFDRTGDIAVILKVEKGRHQVEVTVPVDGILLRGEESTADMYASIDQVMDKIEKQIEKHKTKITQLQGRIRRLEARRTELQNTEILGRVEIITATPEDLAAIMRSLTNKGGKAK